MVKISIKPLSLNMAYRGRRFATTELKSFKQRVLWSLPKMKVPKGKLQVKYEFGVSSKNIDGDNLIKAFQDCLAEKYGFNDNMIYRWEVEKVYVKKGVEYIKFELKALENV